MPIDYNNVKMTRVLLNTNDATIQDNFFKIQLVVPIDKVIHIDILSSSISGALLQIDTWGENVTSKGRLYWRYLDSDTNQRYIEWQTKENLYKDPYTLREIAYSLWNTDSSPYINVIPREGISIELMVYSLYV